MRSPLVPGAVTIAEVYQCRSPEPEVRSERKARAKAKGAPKALMNAQGWLLPEQIPMFTKGCNAEFWIAGIKMDPVTIRAPAALTDVNITGEAMMEDHKCGDEEAQALAKEIELRLTAAKDRPEDPDVAEIKEERQQMEEWEAKQQEAENDETIRELILSKRFMIWVEANKAEIEKEFNEAHAASFAAATQLSEIRGNSDTAALDLTVVGLDDNRPWDFRRKA